jgi:Tol biopolymer transport system component
MLGRFRIQRTYAVLYPFFLSLLLIAPYYWILQVLSDKAASLVTLVIGIACFIIYASIFFAYQIIAQQDGISIRWFLWKKQFIPWSSIKKIKFARGKIYFEQQGKLHHIKVSSHLNNYMGLMELIQTYAPNVEMDIDFYRCMEQGHCEPPAMRIWFTGIYLMFTLLFLWRFIIVLNGPVFDYILLLIVFFFYGAVCATHRVLISYRHPQKGLIISYVNLSFKIIIIFLFAGMFMGIETWVYLIVGLIALIALFLMLVSFNERISNRKLLKFSGVCLLFGMILYANVLWSRQNIQIKSWKTLPQRIFSIAYTQDGTEVCIKGFQPQKTPSGKTELVDYETHINLTTSAITSTLYDIGSRATISKAPDGKKLAFQLSYNRGSTIDLYIRDTGMKAKELIARVEKKDKTEIHSFISRQAPEIQWSPNSRYLAFWEQNSDSSEANRSITIYDTESKQKKNLIKIDAPADRIFWMNDSTIRFLTYQLATVRRKDTIRYYTIWDLDINSKKPIAVYKPSQNWGWHEVYRNGKYLLVVEPYPYNWSEGTTYIYSMDSFKRYAVSTTYAMDFHPREDRLIYVEGKGKSTQIVEYNIATQQRWIIVTEPGEIKIPGYSPSGNQIVYAVDQDYIRKALYLINSDRSHKQKIISFNLFTYLSFLPNNVYAWAPNEKQMVIAKDEFAKDLNTHLYLVTFK